MTNQNGQHPPCHVCGQPALVDKHYGPAKPEGPLCGKDCARAYFIGLQIAMVRVALLQGQQPAQQQGPQIVVPRS